MFFMEKKLKHLEFIVNVITRFNTNSFLIKGWAITLISALFALAAKDADKLCPLATYIPLPMFWIMDGFFLSKERQYRDLYKHVSALEESKIDFSMNTEKFNAGRNTWLNSIFSRTLITFYGTFAVFTLILMFVISEAPAGMKN